VKPLRDQLQVVKCQASLWTATSDFSLLRVLRELPAEFEGRLDAEPQVLPHIDGLPPEVPRLVLASKSAEWRMEIGPSRTNLHWQRQGPTEGSIGLIEFFQSVVRLPVGVGTPVTRAAAVLQRYVAMPNPALFLADHFCKPSMRGGPLNRPENFELHAHKTYEFVPGVRTNSWVRCKTALLDEAEAKSPILLVEQDLNTVADAPLPLSTQQQAEFFGRVVSEFSEAIRLYFP
jgi:hypothetical protein